MTKKQLKEKYENWNKGITSYDNEKDKIFRELQDLAEAATGDVSCCLESNFLEALKGEKAGRAMYLFERYHKIEGANMAMMHFAVDTDNFKI